MGYYLITQPAPKLQELGVAAIIRFGIDHMPTGHVRLKVDVNSQERTITVSDGQASSTYTFEELGG